MGMPRWLIVFTTITVGLTGAAFVLSGLAQTPLPNPFHGSFLTSSALMLNVGIWAIVWHAAYLLFIEKDLRLRRLAAFSAGLFSRHNIYHRILPVLLTSLFLGAFTAYKIMIPLVNPFSHDAMFSDLDRMIFGTDPWRLTHALVGPTGTAVIDYVYVLWFPAFLIIPILVSLFCDMGIRKRYFFSFIGVWGLLGLGLATLWSSAGPCFLELIGHPYQDRYADLLPVAGAPYAMVGQEYLAQGYREGGMGIAKGISAMPSIHVSVAALYVLLARQCHRVFLVPALIFYALILFGSVHLGYHYFVDGIAGTAGTVGIWWMVGKLVSRPAPAEETMGVPAA
ncbi:membrane-associated phospholipid phosphatase [Hyphomonas adhaerens MHS-3]|uniref:Membrane-associated phospholipid phosphatase n=2 Tax=Hyphomonas adhaerens TaxID=81029 RepID=A0A069E4U7_9PROT|nr:membrane-associated phospholipid phosphatase [Hyphomonas adhaerens MHS-3]